MLKETRRPRAARFSRAAALILCAASSYANAGTPKAPLPAASVAAQVESAFKAHCARCHQAGALEDYAPSGGLGDILALDALAGDPHLVQPGNPDGSRLFAYLLDIGHWNDVEQGDPRPSASEVAAVHAWIAGLAAERRACPDRKVLGPRETDVAIRAWLDVFGRDAARDTRFVTLAHIQKDCATGSEMAAYRAAVDKLLNGLSSNEAIVRASAIDETGAILAVRLSSLGWSPSRWHDVASAQPEAGTFAAASPSVVQATGAARPLVRADWLAHAAFRPDLYYKLSAAPDRLEDLKRSLGMEAGASPVADATIAESRVTGGPRLIERFETRNGPAWFARDGGANAKGGRGARRTARTRVFFTLPNGFLAFALFDAEGRRADEAATGTGGRSLRASGPARAGLACLGCHANGALPLGGALAPAVEFDSRHSRSALIRAGIDPDTTIRGLEIIEGLARRWSGDVEFRRAASELNLDGAEFSKRLDELAGPAEILARRLRRGALTRSEANELMTHVAGSGETEAGNLSASEPAADITLKLWSDKLDYRVGDRPKFEIETSAPCHLTLVSIDPKGFATVLFPNDFERDALIVPGKRASAPGPLSVYDLRFNEAGREEIVAICEENREFSSKIRHRFSSEHFTSLGNWREFVAGAGLGTAQPPPGRAAIVIEVRE